MKMSILAIGIVGMLLTMPGDVTAQQIANTDNVVIVLDDSGSMDGTFGRPRQDKMTAAKAGIREVLKLVPQTTQVGLLALNAGWLYTLQARNDVELHAIIDHVDAAGGTYLGAAMKKGADALLAQREKQYGYGSYRLLVVTDGAADDQGAVDQYTPEIMARGITIDVIGVDLAQGHILQTRVHSYRAADDPASLTRAIKEVLAESVSIGTDSADDAFAAIAPLPDDLAAGAIKALAASGNHPIGGQPVVAGHWDTTPASPQPVYTGPTTTAPAPAPTPATSSDLGGVVIIVLVILGLLFLVLIIGGSR